MTQLRALANSHEWDLAYNSSSPIRAIAGSQLAAEITQFLTSAISKGGSLTGKKIGVQFGAYASFASFFGLAGLADLESEPDVDFRGVVDYASSIVFELFTNSTASTDYPSTDDIFVRFLFHNGTASNASTPQTYPLFGSGQDALSWNDFQNGMDKFSIGDTQQWCVACGNFTGECAAYSPDESSNGRASSSDAGSTTCANGMSAAVNGVIGAMVTLAVVLGLEGLIMLVGGFRVVKKRKAVSGASAAEGDLKA